MLSNDCKRRVIIALVVLATTLTIFVGFATMGYDIFMDIPAPIEAK